MADIIEKATQYRIKGIEKAEIEYYKSLTRSLDKIEDQIVSLANASLPTTSGKLIDLQSAIAIRPKIKSILEKEYLGWADTVTRKGFNQQAKRVEKAFKTIGIIPVEFQELTKGDLALVKNLKQQYFTQFKDVSNEFTTILSDKIYQNTLIGTDITILNKELRTSINGIYSVSNDDAVNRLVSYVKNNKDNPLLATKVDSAIKILQSKYASTRVGVNMKRYAGQILNDGLRDFDATLNFNKANDAGLTYVKYYGDVIPTTRSHCRNMINGVYDRSGKGIYTIADINRIWNSNSWSGKNGSNPLVVRGGYNCRHQFSYVNPDWYEEDLVEGATEQVTKDVLVEKGLNVTSLLNPITLSAIKTVPKAVSQANMAKGFKKGFDDARYPRDFEGKPITRYKGGKTVGTNIFNHLDDKLSTQISVIMKELDDLAVKYKVPPLRGIRSSTRGGNIAGMGDGVLSVNPPRMNYLEKQEISLTYHSRKTGLSKELIKKQWKNYKLGDPSTFKPWSAKSFFPDDELMALRQTMYHEFGHHVHQMTGVNQSIAGTFNYGYIPKIEAKLTQLPNRISPTQYGDSDKYEWFAENFSVYNMGRKDLADPQFIKLIEEILK